MRKLISLILAVILLAAVLPGATADTARDEAIHSRFRLENHFNDITASDMVTWWYGGMQRAILAGLLFANESGNIRPNALLTRAETAGMFWGLSGMPEPIGNNPFVDMEDDLLYTKAAT